MSMQWLHASLVREGPFLTATRPLHRSAKQFYADPLKERIIEIPMEEDWPVPGSRCRKTPSSSPNEGTIFA